jgi:hypothetical protein
MLQDRPARIEPEASFRMMTIAEGKEAVLEYLEHEAQDIAGQPGVYRLVRDDAGNLVAFIAGRSFLGTGSYSLGGNRMAVMDGLVVHVQQHSGT